MSWGTELWDQYDNIALHTQKGIEFLDRYGSFIRDRCAIEVEYATKLRRLVKNYQPKKKEEEDFEFTSWSAFRNVLKEISDLAGQRELVSEDLQAQVITKILLLSKELRDDRKKWLAEGAQLTQMLNSQISALERAKRNYEKAYRESEKAVENYQKADADLNLSRAEVEKYKHTMTMKCGQADDAKNEYANQLQKTNKLQQQHYEVSLPSVFDRLQEIDEKRTRGLKEFIRSAADVETSVSPIIARCLEGISKAAESINEKEDSAKVIERYQSGFPQPQDIPFEDLSKSDSEVSHSIPSSYPVLTLNKINTINGSKLKKRTKIFGIFATNKNTMSTDGVKEDFSDLAPNQRRKKLLAKIQELQQKINQETAARDGLMKMKGVYESNSNLGNPMTVEGQLNESEHKLNKLKTELAKFQDYLDKANSVLIAQHSPRASRLDQNDQRNSRNSNGSQDGDDNEEQHDDESLSRSASENSVAQARNGLNNNNGFSASPESGLGTSNTSIPGSVHGSSSVNEQINGYEIEPLQPLGTCKALYPFEATSEGSIPMDEGEELQIIELDQGDGWTRVRRLNGPNGWEEGFVPTTYIESTLFA